MSWQFRMILTITPFLLVGEIYLLTRLTLSILRVFNVENRWYRWLLLSLIFFFNMLPILIIFHYITGNLHNFFTIRDNLDWQDYFFNFPFWWALILTFEIVPYFLVLEFFSLFLKIFKIKIKKISDIVRISIVIILVIFGSLRIITDTFFVKDSRTNIIIKNLPKSLENFNITLIGDIHFDRYLTQTKVNQIENLLSKQNSKLLLFSGDLISRGENFINKGLNFLCQMNQSDYKVACLGDHDYWNNPQRIIKGFKDCGWTFLENKHLLIHHKNSKILVTGITQIYSQRIPQKELDQILKNSPNADIKILLVHQPTKYIHEIANQNNYNILVAGHTHGGQIVFIPFGFTFTPSKFESPFFRGNKRYDKLHSIITNGIGLTLAPLRYGAPAELTQIILKRN